MGDVRSRELNSEFVIRDLFIVFDTRIMTRMSFSPPRASAQRLERGGARNYVGHYHLLRSTSCLGTFWEPDPTMAIGSETRRATQPRTQQSSHAPRTSPGGRTRMHSDNGAKERPTQRAQEAHKLIQLRRPTSSAQALEAPYLLSIPSRPCLS